MNCMAKSKPESTTIQFLFCLSSHNTNSTKIFQFFRFAVLILKDWNCGLRNLSETVHCKTTQISMKEIWVPQLGSVLQPMKMAKKYKTDIDRKWNAVTLGHQPIFSCLCVCPHSFILFSRKTLGESEGLRQHSLLHVCLFSLSVSMIPLYKIHNLIFYQNIYHYIIKYI